MCAKGLHVTDRHARYWSTLLQQEKSCWKGFEIETILYDLNRKKNVNYPFENSLLQGN